MTRLYLLAIGFLCARCAPPGEDTTTGQSPLHVVPESIILESVEIGELREFSFMLVNTSANVLEIGEPVSSCSCTVVEGSYEPLAPQERRPFRGSVRPNSRIPKDQWLRFQAGGKNVTLTVRHFPPMLSYWDQPEYLLANVSRKQDTEVLLHFNLMLRPSGDYGMRNGEVPVFITDAPALLSVRDVRESSTSLAGRAARRFQVVAVLSPRAASAVTSDEWTSIGVNALHPDLKTTFDRMELRWKWRSDLLVRKNVISLERGQPAACFIVESSDPIDIDSITVLDSLDGSRAEFSILPQDPSMRLDGALELVSDICMTLEIKVPLANDDRTVLRWQLQHPSSKAPIPLLAILK